MKKYKDKIITALVIIGIIAYLVCLYPLKVYVDNDGDTRCESLVGLKVGC